MKRVSALDLRQSLGKVVRDLKRTGEPVILEKRHEAVAVLITLEDFEERFAEKAASSARRVLLAKMDAMARQSIDAVAAEEILAEVRGNG